jgi:hypothetical protein
MSQDLDKLFKKQSDRTDFRTNSQDNLGDDAKRSFTILKKNIRRIFFESIAGLDDDDLTYTEKCERDDYLKNP